MTPPDRFEKEAQELALQTVNNIADYLPMTDEEGAKQVLFTIPLAELLRDKARLDWLKERFTEVSAKARNRIGVVRYEFEWQATTPEELVSLRSAIDSAMQKEQSK